MGNVIGTIGDGKRSVMLAGYYDQLGFMVKYVDDDGFAAFTNVGGWDKRVAYGTRVKMWVGDGPEDYLVGAVAVKAAHLTDEKERDKSPEIKDMLIDFGAKSREEAEGMGIKPGVVCTPYLDVTHLGSEGSDFIVGPAFDDVCCVAGLVEAMKTLKKDPPKNLKVCFVATVQEEVGLRGVTIAAYNLNPWAAIATDVIHAVAPSVKANQVGGIRLGKGPRGVGGRQLHARPLGDGGGGGREARHPVSEDRRTVPQQHGRLGYTGRAGRHHLRLDQHAQQVHAQPQRGHKPHGPGEPGEADGSDGQGAGRVRPSAHRRGLPTVTPIP